MKLMKKFSEAISASFSKFAALGLPVFLPPYRDDESEIESPMLLLRSFPRKKLTILLLADSTFPSSPQTKKNHPPPTTCRDIEESDC